MTGGDRLARALVTPLVVAMMLVALAGPLLSHARAAAAELEIVFADGFESGDLSSWDNAAAGRYAVTADPAHVRTGSYALEGTIPAGDGWGELNKWFLPGYDDIYVRFDVMFEDGFQNLRGDGNGMHFVSVNGNRTDNKWSAHGQAGIIPDGTDFFTTTVDPAHQYGDDALQPLLFYSYFPDMSCCYGNLFPQDDPKVRTSTGVWHEIIIHVDAGTPGAYDGGQQLWIDGRLVVDAGGMRWRDTDELRLNEFAIVDYMPGSPRTQHIWFDNVLVTTGFPGSNVGPPSRFLDVPAGHLVSAEIEWLADAAITRGCNPPQNDLYCPDEPVTRGQMAAFLARALALPAVPGMDAFSDDDTSVFEADIERIRAAGITRGCNPPENDRYCPAETVTREQMAAFLNRALGLAPGVTGNFVDTVDSRFAADIDAVAAAGITRGCNPPQNDRFCPRDPVTRGQMAAFLFRALGG
jgi:hypothetical protein